MTAIQAQNLQGNVIHTWFRCLLKLSPSHEGLAEFTRYFLLFLQACMDVRKILFHSCQIHINARTYAWFI